MVYYLHDIDSWVDTEDPFEDDDGEYHLPSCSDPAWLELTFSNKEEFRKWQEKDERILDLDGE
jgi:hypothetical protein